MKIGNALRITTLILFASLIMVLLQNIYIKVSTYTYTTSKIQNSFRIVQVTDLHSKEYGRNNQRLINKIKEQKPDLILMTGDMLNDTDISREVIVNLVKEAVNIAPVYYSIGNHENDYENYTDLKTDLEAAGADIMEDRYEDVDVNGNTIRIFGAYAFIGAHYESNVIHELMSFVKTDNLKIIMSHVPSRFAYQDRDIWMFDMVFSGHYHGGQIRIPFIGGVKTPDEWFPEYDMGRYDKEEYSLFISSGLGSETWIPRINNPPEILVVDVVSEKQHGRIYK